MGPVPLAQLFLGRFGHIDFRVADLFELGRIGAVDVAILSIKIHRTLQLELEFGEGV